MARMNISIPDELKEQMDSCPELNWSSIAQEAFTTQVGINRLKGIDMQAAGIERLRASKKSNREREHAEGIALGKQWALRRAQYDELRAVAKLSEESGDGLLGYVMDSVGESASDADAIEVLFNTKAPSDELVEGFIEGAAAVLDEV